jgi:signal transduction histidine kinase
MLAAARDLRLFRSAGVRLATLYAMVFGVSAAALVAFLWWATAGLLDRQVEVAIRADAVALSERWDEGGLPALVATIRERLLGNVDDDAIYLLEDRQGDVVTGNLQSWPAGVTRADAWYELLVERAGVRSLARVQRYDLPGGYRLLVGRDVRTRAQLRRVLEDALFWSMLVVVVLGVLGAVLVRSLFRRMVANVSATAGAIAAGDLTRRVRVTGRGDEFDRVAETINDMLDRIARLMDGVKQVSNAIAHDLRTPIARARARLEDAGAHARNEEDLRAAVERATADLDGVDSVFQALLRIAEIEAGARRSAFAALDLTTLLTDLAELYGAVAEERDITLTLHADPPLPAWGDRELIQQAVANLLDNAVKFSPEGAEITLRASTRPGVVRISVGDRGPGIPEEDRNRATERFYRGETARHTPGSGLGLALVQAVAQLHGGALLLEDNQPGLCAVLVLAAEPEG